MKNKYLIGLLCAVVLAGLFTIAKAPAQGHNQRRSDVVEILFTEAWSGGRPFQMSVYWIDASPNAPLVEVGASRAAVISYYKSLGFTWTASSSGATRILFERD